MHTIRTAPVRRRGVCFLVRDTQCVDSGVDNTHFIHRYGSEMGPKLAALRWFPDALDPSRRLILQTIIRNRAHGCSVKRKSVDERRRCTDDFRLTVHTQSYSTAVFRVFP